MCRGGAKGVDRIHAHKETRFKANNFNQWTETLHRRADMRYKLGEGQTEWEGYLEDSY